MRSCVARRRFALDKQPNIGHISSGKSNTIFIVIGEFTVPLVYISSLFKRPGILLYIEDSKRQ